MKTIDLAVGPLQPLPHLAGIQLQITEPTAHIGLIADPHLPATPAAYEGFQKLAVVFNDYELDAIGCLGDEGDGLEDFLRNELGIDGSWDFLRTLGNHDGNNPHTYRNGDLPLGVSPFSERIQEPPFYGSEFYSRVYGEALVLVTQNNAPLEYEGIDWYANCNPPAAVSGNEDWSGITVDGSVQQRWAQSELSRSSQKWKIALGHRPYWSTFSQPRRAMLVGGRVTLEAMCYEGLTLSAGGDEHVGCLLGPMNPITGSHQAEGGVYCLTLGGGFSMRPIDVDAVPDPTTIIWASEGAPNGTVHGAICSTGEKFRLQVFEVRPGDTEARKVVDTFLKENWGLPS